MDDLTTVLADIEPCPPWSSCAISHMRGHGDALLIDGRWHHVTLRPLPDPPDQPPPADDTCPTCNDDERGAFVVNPLTPEMEPVCIPCPTCGSGRVPAADHVTDEMVKAALRADHKFAYEQGNRGAEDRMRNALAAAFAAAPTADEKEEG